MEVPQSLSAEDGVGAILVRTRTPLAIVLRTRMALAIVLRTHMPAFTSRESRPLHAMTSARVNSIHRRQALKVLVFIRSPTHLLPPLRLFHISA